MTLYVCIGQEESGVLACTARRNHARYDPMGVLCYPKVHRSCRNLVAVSRNTHPEAPRAPQRHGHNECGSRNMSNSKYGGRQQGTGQYQYETPKWN